MRRSLVAAVMSLLLSLGACGGDTALSPRNPHDVNVDSDVPADLLADYTVVHLPGSGYVVDVNDVGDVAGLGPSGGVLWSGSQHVRSEIPILPTALANDRTVIGVVDGHAARWQAGVVTILDTATSTANAICRCASQTIVGSVVVNGVTHAAIWVGGVRIDAGMPDGASDAEFTAIANGFIVGNATAPTLNPATDQISLAPQAFTWSHADGWRQLGTLGTLWSGVVDVNSAGTSAGYEQRILFPDLIGATWDASGRRNPLFGIPPYLRSILPSAISESGQFAANGADEGSGTLPLVGAQILPPGKYGDLTTSINSSNVVGGQSEGGPAIWIPN